MQKYAIGHVTFHRGDGRRVRKVKNASTCRVRSVVVKDFYIIQTLIALCPVLGLLGTVWGVMDAFSGMADSGSAALSAVAPGISGALLTTIIGLIVALPSMIGYNLLSSKIRFIAVQMDNFSQELISRIGNENNIKVLKNIYNCSGFLIGGASLKYKSFTNLIKNYYK